MPPPGPPAGPYGPLPPSGDQKNPALIVAIVVVVALAVGGIAYALTSGGDDKPERASSTNTLPSGGEGPDVTTVPDITLPDSGDSGGSDITLPDDSEVSLPDVTLPSGGGLPEAGAPDQPPTGNATLDDLADGCYQGDMQSCDDLFFQSDFGSEYEAYGNTCGGRFDEPVGYCTTILTDPELPN